MAGAPDAPHVIPVEDAVTLNGLFRERVKRTPELEAYRHFDSATSGWQSLTWSQMDAHVARWQAAFAREGLVTGDRVAIMLRNCPEWVMCDIAALGLGLVVVPLYTQDRPDNTAYIVRNAGCRLLLMEGADQWKALAPAHANLEGLVRIVALRPIENGAANPRLPALGDWLRDAAGETRHSADGSALATIVYTSGTTGRPKG